MLIFHEGLPGSGKSYEAVVKHIIPALASGREVYAFVEGLDCQKLAAVIGTTEEVIRSLLHYVERDSVRTIDKVVSDNSFVVIDELQNFWSSKGDNCSISQDIINFVSEHRHRGLDILAMGQDFRDVHAMWRRRVDRKIHFMNLDALGLSGRYRWTLYKSTAPDKFTQVSGGVQKYDKKYFGTYKSYVSDDTNTGNYRDSRAVIWNSWTFRLVFICLLIVLPLSITYLVRLFNPSTSSLIKRDSVPVSSTSPAGHLPPASSVRSVPVSPSPSSTLPKPVDASKPAVPADYVTAFTASGRVRLVSVLSGFNREPYVVVEFRDASYRVLERLDTHMLNSLGWSIQVVSLRLVRLHKLGQPELIATAWPIEPFGELSDRQLEGVRSSGSGSRSAPASSSSSSLVASSTPAPTPSPLPYVPAGVSGQLSLQANGASSIPWSAAKVTR